MSFLEFIRSFEPPQEPGGAALERARALLQEDMKEGTWEAVRQSEESLVVVFRFYTLLNVPSDWINEILWEQMSSSLAERPHLAVRIKQLQTQVLEMEVEAIIPKTWINFKTQDETRLVGELGKFCFVHRYEFDKGTHVFRCSVPQENGPGLARAEIEKLGGTISNEFVQRERYIFDARFS